MDEIQSWLDRLSEGSKPPNRNRWTHFIDWLHEQPGWENATPESLLEFQEKMTGRARFTLLRLIQKHVKEKGGTRKGIDSRYRSIRSFFLHSGVELPKDPSWDPGSGTREPARGRLSVDAIRRVVEGAKLRDRAVFLTLFQGIMDLQRFEDFNLRYAGELVDHLRTQGVGKPFRIDFTKGRKGNHNAFYTFIGKDALTAWIEYFEKERGWPQKDKPLAVVRGTENPLTQESLRFVFDRLCMRYGFKPKGHKKGDTGYRTGVSLHRFRSVVRSHLQTAKSDGLDETCIEYWMGHNIDPLNYNKFAELEPQYVERNYAIAERYLNIMSSTSGTKQLKEQEGKILDLQAAINGLQEEVRDRDLRHEKEKEELYEVVRQMDSRVQELLGKKEKQEAGTFQSIMRIGGWPVLNPVANKHLSADEPQK